MRTEMYRIGFESLQIIYIYFDAVSKLLSKLLKKQLTKTIIRRSNP